MYYALKDIRIGIAPKKPGERGSVRAVKAGEPIPEALEWPFLIQTANVQNSSIAWRGEGLPPHEVPSKAQPMRAPTSFRRSAPASVTPVQAKSDDASSNESEKTEPAVVNSGEDALTCSECPGSEFKTQRGLSAHRKIKHAEDLNQKAG